MEGNVILKFCGSLGAKYGEIRKTLTDNSLDEQLNNFLAHLSKYI